VAVANVDDGLAAVELAGRLEQERYLLGAVEVNRPGLRDLHPATLADRRIALAIVLAVATAVGKAPDGLSVLAGLVPAAAAGSYGSLRRGAARTIGIAVACCQAAARSRS
jgi:hypothetical protein